MKKLTCLLFAALIALPGLAEEEKKPTAEEVAKAKKAKAWKAAEAARKGNVNAAHLFELMGTDKKKYALKDFVGKVIVLEWVNHGCPFVKKHYRSGNMQALQKKYGAKGVVWFSICSSAEGKQGHMSIEKWNKFNDANGVATTAVLLDPEGKVGRAYEAKTTPQICIINETLIRVYDGAIDDKRSADPADIKTSKNYVDSILPFVMAGKESPLRRTRPYGCSVKYARRKKAVQ